MGNSINMKNANYNIITSLKFYVDEEVTKQHFEIAEKNKGARFFLNSPSGIGPYPSRDVLAQTREKDIILFHDSDDISTSDRAATLIHSLSTDKLDAVGSHELRIDKIEKKSDF